MNHSLRKLIHGTVATVTALGFSTLGLAASTFAAGTLTAVSVTPTSTKATASGVSYAVKFSTASTSNIREVKFEFSTTPSDTNGSSGILGATSKPSNMVIPSAATPSSVTNGSGGSSAPYAAFAANTSTNDTSLGTVLYDLGAGNSVASGSGTSWIFTIAGFTNPAVGDCSATQTNTDTCYVRIITYDNAGNPLDAAVGSFTVTTPILLSATVDPYMTFALAGVNSNFSTYDTNLGSGTALTNTTATLIQFGNITVGTPKYAMHQLDVRTNASTGYWVYQKMTTSNNSALVGTFNSNKIDPFDNSSSWAGNFQTVTPASWAEPTGNVNTKSGWLGLRSDGGSTGISSFGTGWVGPVVLNGGTGGAVKHSTGPDNGTSSTTSYVSYKISVDAYQPADSYTGSMEYNVVATY